MKTLWSVRLLTILALVGLLLAPIGTAIAVPLATMPMQATSFDPANMDMECCPDQQLPDCGKSCPFLILCQTAPGGMLAMHHHPLELQIVGRAGLERVDGNGPPSLAGEPPTRPPRF